jgi:hypothetical protein
MVAMNCTLPAVLAVVLAAAPAGTAPAPTVDDEQGQQYRTALAHIWPDLSTYRISYLAFDLEQRMAACTAGTPLECDCLYVLFSMQKDHRAKRALQLAITGHAARCAEGDSESCAKAALMHRFRLDQGTALPGPSLDTVARELATTCHSGAQPAPCLTAARLELYIPEAVSRSTTDEPLDLFGLACRNGNAKLCIDVGVEVSRVQPPADSPFFAEQLKSRGRLTEECDKGQTSSCLELAKTLQSREMRTARDGARARSILDTICRGQTPYKQLACERLNATGQVAAAESSRAPAPSATNTAQPNALTNVLMQKLRQRAATQQATVHLKEEQQLVPVRLACQLGSKLACRALEDGGGRGPERGRLPEGSIRELHVSEVLHRGCRNGDEVQCRRLRQMGALTEEYLSMLMRSIPIDSFFAALDGLRGDGCYRSIDPDCLGSEYRLLYPGADESRGDRP